MPPQSLLLLRPTRLVARLARWLSCVFALGLSTLTATASGELVTTLHALKPVVTRGADGKPVARLQAFSKIQPEEVATFLVACKNTSSAALGGVVVTLPIPREMALIEGSADTPLARVDYSIDGGAHFAPLAALAIATPDGASRPALPADINHVRWTFASEIGPLASAEVLCRAVLR